MIMLINDINFVFEILFFILKRFVKKEIYDYGKFCKFRNRVFLYKKNFLLNY